MTEIRHSGFSKYDPAQIKEVFLSSKTASGEEIENFLIYKITFRGSPLKNSPEISLKLENTDIWPSVEEASHKGCIDLASLKDIANFSFRTDKTKKTVRSQVLPSGDILFTMEDSGLLPEMKELIKDKFLRKFGIPLYTPIVNDKFDEGKADKTDYVMGQSNSKAVSEGARGILDTLIAEGLIEETKSYYMACEACNTLKRIESDEELPDECDCGNPSLKKSTDSLLSIETSIITKYIKDSLRPFCEEKGWSKPKDSKIKIGEDSYSYLRLENEQEAKLLNIWISEQLLPRRVISRIERMMTPTIIIFIGHQERFLENFSNNCILPVSFGKLYNEKEQMFLYSCLTESLFLRSKTYLANAADKAFDKLQKTIEIEKFSSKEYTDKEFEDDVFALFKDMFPNAEKWGKEMSGEKVPEGILALSHRETRGIQKHDINRVYSYDCKLTDKSKGYNLSSSEQRKAVDYVNKLNRNDYITSFSDINQLSGHIFVSNKFNDNNFNTMTEHFYEELSSGYLARPIFLPVEVLVYLYQEYRRYHDQISNSRKTFISCVIEIFEKDEHPISKKDIDKVIRKSINPKLFDHEVLDTKEVSREMKED
ncbi:hypothetical protein ABE354_02990 [Brevibacillus laterosporus]|uniref:hypothetical protein n=1 Tax=Brevibacillus laterosporus TaxID=1465 RepID=UPI003D2317C6